MSQPLYELGQEFKALQALDPDEIGQETIDDTMEAIGGEFEDKAVACEFKALSAQAEIDVIDIEIKRLQAKKKIRQNFHDRLREYLRRNMVATGINLIEHPLFKIRLCKPSTKVEIIDEESLPDDYVNIKTVVTPDKKKIAADLKAGKDIPGAGLVESQPRLLIK